MDLVGCPKPDKRLMENLGKYPHGLSFTNYGWSLTLHGRLACLGGGLLGARGIGGQRGPHGTCLVSGLGHLYITKTHVATVSDGSFRESKCPREGGGKERLQRAPGPHYQGTVRCRWTGLAYSSLCSPRLEPLLWTWTTHSNFCKSFHLQLLEFDAFCGLGCWNQITPLKKTGKELGYL